MFWADLKRESSNNQEWRNEAHRGLFIEFLVHFFRILLVVQFILYINSCRNVCADIENGGLFTLRDSESE